MTTLEIQRRLKALGYEPGPLDGVRGRLTIGATKRFQTEHGLKADGIVGPLTRAILFPPLPASGQGRTPPSPTEGEGGPAVPWFEEALRLKGTLEAKGTADNAKILGWARRLRLGYAHDSIAWCGLFVAHCIAISLPNEPLPNNPLGARNWLKFGSAIKPIPGAVLVFWRGSKAGWNGHVGFYAGEDASAFHVLGGNQSDAVTIARVSKERLLGARWPATALPAQASVLVTDAISELSTNEA